MKTYGSAAFLFLCLSLQILTGVASPIFFSEEVDEYDDKLSTFIKEILENLRDQMPDGIPDIGVPPLDPLSIPDIDHRVDDGMAQLELRMRQLHVTGLSNFSINLLRADLERGFANISITLPQLTASGHCYMSGKIMGIFPLNADGPFDIRVSKVEIRGYGDLNITTDHGKASVHMNDLKLGLAFRGLEVQMDSLLGGTHFAKSVLKLLSGLGPRIFAHFDQEVMEVVNSALLALVNSELDKGTLSDLLELIPFFAH